MKTFKYTLIATFFICSLVSARSGKISKRDNGKNLKSDIEFYFEKDNSNNNDNQLERKRSHKRRRQIRKPIKGLR